jgi:hypothetical protein
MADNLTLYKAHFFKKNRILVRFNINGNVFNIKRNVKGTKAILVYKNARFYINNQINDSFSFSIYPFFQKVLSYTIV